MSKRRYFPNGTINDERLPFIIQITTGLTVYYSLSGSKQLFKADSLFQKKIQTLNISIDDYNIIVTGRKKTGFIYKIYHKGVELKDENNTTDK